MFERSIKLIIESKISQIQPLAKGVRGICSCATQDDLLLYHIELCLVEAVTNIINHAYHRVPGKSIVVDVAFDEDRLTIQLFDSGDKSSIEKPKDQLDYDLNDITTLPESGMGLFIIYQIMDEVTFSESDGKNVLTMEKNLKKALK